jgi:putative ATPase
MDLFKSNLKKPFNGINHIPLAERSRPERLDDFAGHEEMIGQGTILAKEIENASIKSMIFWGPPGVGKTTLAKIIANEVNFDFHSISAVASSVKEVRQIIENAKKLLKHSGQRSILFIDEIHRFNKAQQDVLLEAVETGIIILIGATTENPSFEVISPLLSRTQVYQMKMLTNKQIKQIVARALKIDKFFSKKEIKIESWESLYKLSNGDARRVLNIIEKAYELADRSKKSIIFNKVLFEKAALEKILYYDKNGDMHYDLISAFIKSIRGSDPDASIYWMARMLEAGEDPKFIARRMLILASEDIGNADPNALIIATSCFTAVNYVGLPEAKIILSQVAAYLATTPKSNSAVKAINMAIEDVRKYPDLVVPLHLRNAPTSLLKELNYGKNYKYVHDFGEHFIQEDYLPPELKGILYYQPGIEGKELNFLNRLKLLWAGVKKYKDKELDK